MTETIETLYDIISSYDDTFENNSITYKVTKYKSHIDVYMNNKISKDITLSICIDDDNIHINSKDKRKIGDIQLCSLINKKYNKRIYTDDIIDILDYMVKVIPEITNYCVGCQKILDIDSILYINCGDDKCVYKCEELPLGDYVCNYVKNKPSVVEFLITTSLMSVKSKRRKDIFEPFPHYFLKVDKHIKRGTLSALSGEDINALKDFEKIDKTLNSEFFLKYSNSVKKMLIYLHKFDTDMLLENDIGTDSYMLLRFFLMSLESDINEIDIFDKTEYNFTQYSFKHQPEKEKIFNKQTKNESTCYLFHGSGKENWFSIMRNGLKVASHSKLMVNAAAYGRGIYMSPNYNTSLGYSTKYGVGSSIIMGVYEAASPNPSKWKKTSSIYTVPDEKDLILRYLLDIPKNVYTRLASLIDKKFGVTINEERKKGKIMASKRSHKRILGELKKMQSKETNELGFSVMPVDENIMIWNAYMHRDGFDSEQKITKSLYENDIDKIKLEIRFPDKYPFDPPFVRVVYPRFKYRTGHITINGAICHKILSNENWSPGCYIQTLLMDIRCNIMIGEAELEPTLWNTEYSFSAAKSDYIRVMKSHGWK